ncbi:IS6 family transposase [Candidiatus Paracoxiella cheracis]|uniref:IS6 family transposase n=2 Tax=Candidiatus Paracoxiella cheracis TaxID=3405120 RepID=UPI003BF53AD5
MLIIIVFKNFGFVKSQSMLYFVRPFNERLSETTGMNCPHCDSSVTKGLKKLTSLGYKQFVCSDCGKQFNQRSGTALNFIMYPTDVVRTVVQYYYQFKVSLHDVVALMVMRGFHVTHQTVHNWVHRFGPALGMRLRARRYQKSNDRWHVDCTYLRIEGRWCYFYRAIDEKGDLIDVYLSDVRDQQAAENFFKQAAKTSGIYPEQITTDKEPALYPAIQAVFGEYTDHRDNNYLNNRIEQSHRGIKSRMRVMKGFKNIFCALRFCTVFEEIQQFFREKNKNLRTILSKFQTFNQLFQQAF